MYIYIYTHTIAKSRTRKPQPHYPKYSSAHSGHMQFSSGFCQLDVGERKRRRRAVGNARGRSGREVGGRNVILPWLPVISRFYSGRLARQLVLVENVVPVREFSSSPSLVPCPHFKDLLAHENIDGTSR